MTKDTFRILAINPGSTSTKVAVYEDQKLLSSASPPSTAWKNWAGSLPSMDQLPMRASTFSMDWRHRWFDLGTLDAVVGQGGQDPPLPQGAITVNEEMVAYLRARPVFDNHSSNLGGRALRWRSPRRSTSRPTSTSA
jgi:butyrate kinase